MLSATSQLVGSLTAATLILIPGLAEAQQLVVFDVTYTASSATTNDAHFDVEPRPDQPADWTSPIDYAAGKAYIHQEVMTKPSAMDTQVDICFDGDKDGYGCIGTDFYTDTGVHETVEDLSEMWQYDKVDWKIKRSLFQLIVKDRGNHNGGLPQSAFMPTTMRIVFTLVAPGGTYVPPPAAAPIDAGLGQGIDAALPLDAASRFDAGSAHKADAAPPADARVTRPDAAAPTTDSAPTSAPSTPSIPAPSPSTARHRGGCAVGGGGDDQGLVAVGLLALLVADSRRRAARGARPQDV